MKIFCFYVIYLDVFICNLKKQERPKAHQLITLYKITWALTSCLYPGESFVTWFPGKRTLLHMIKFTTGWRSTRGTGLLLLTSHLSYLPEWNQAVIQKTSFVCWTPSWRGIRGLRCFSREENYKVKHNTKSLCFQKAHFLLEKMYRILLPPMFSIYLILTYHKSIFYLYNTRQFTALSQSLSVSFCFKGRSPPRCWRPNTFCYFLHSIHGN